VGGHVARRLLKEGAIVTVLDIDAKPERICLVNNELRKEYSEDRLRIQYGDVTDLDYMKKKIEDGNFNYIFHFAAYAAVVEKAADNPLKTFQANTMGLFNMLEAVRVLKHNPPTVFFASTDKVYGEMKEGEETYDEEKTSLRGIGVYDSTKLAADVFARTYHEVYELKTTVLRMCNLFGPWDLNFDYRLLPKAMRCIYKDNSPCPPELYYDSLGHCREYLYIDDVVDIILQLTCRYECAGEVYNLPGVCYYSTPAMLKKIVDTAADVERKSGKKEIGENISQNGIVLRVRPIDKVVISIRKQKMRGDKLKKTLGEDFPEYVDFDRALWDTIEWYRRNKVFFK